MKTALQIVKNGDTEDRKAKEQARDEKANKWTDPSSANSPEDNPQEKNWVEDGSGKKSNSEERKEPYIRERSHTK